MPFFVPWPLTYGNCRIDLNNFVGSEDAHINEVDAKGDRRANVYVGLEDWKTGKL
jgi:hypothetical protein